MIEDPNDWMWFRALSMLDKAEHLRHGFSQKKQSQQAHSVWQPPVDIFETGQTLWVVIAVPGVSPKSIKMIVKSGTLIINGERRLPSELRRAVVHRMEMPQGCFERRLELPPGYFELGEYKVIDGCLILQLNKLI